MTMTNEEAIRRIKEFGLYHAIGDLSNSAKTVEAFNMAIEALQKEAERQEMVIRASERHLGLVRCKDCRKRGSDDCPMFSREWRTIMRGNKCVDDFVFHDLTEPNGFCSYGKGDNNE